MCFFCEKYGEDGGLWYLNPKLYARQLYRRKIDNEKYVPDAISYRKEREELFLKYDEARLLKDKKKVELYKEQLSNMYKENEPCQVVPIEDAFKVVDLANPISTMSCICRKVMRAKDERCPDEYSCTGLGTGMLKWERWPERYRGGVNFANPDDVKEWLLKWNKRGMVHIIMCYGTNEEGYPFVGGICNCDYPDCEAIRRRIDLDIHFSLLKSHYLAQIDYEKCTGCGTCAKRCQFGAIKMEVHFKKANIDQLRCFGCGVCATGCPEGAISLIPKKEFPVLMEDY